MGLLRLILAAAVVFAHTPLHTALTGGRLAVEAFFMISGFYVALVLERNYRRPSDFYVNRYLRLAPIYVAVAAASLASWLLMGIKPFPESAAPFSELSPSAVGFLVATNATLFFQDMTMFMCDGSHGLHWVSDFRACDPPLYGALLIPQAWSLGVEIAFYALAPWLLRLRGSWLVAICVASVAVKAGLFVAGFRHDPWDYRFFPSELCLFLAGSLAYRWRGRFAWLGEARRPRLKVIGVIAFALAFSRLPFGGGLHWLFLGGLFFSLPALLRFSSDHAWDRRIGEVSYPLYLSHVLVIGWLHHASSGLGEWSFSLLALVTAFVLSYALYRLVDIPMERLRAARRRRDVEPRTTELRSLA
jgi:peptidoglycan/LPS O-acetylase OafA/YrhL